jgi:hypothetical protein
MNQSAPGTSWIIACTPDGLTPAVSFKTPRAHCDKSMSASAGEAEPAPPCRVLGLGHRFEPLSEGRLMTPS